MFKRPAAKRGYNRPLHAGHPTVAAAAATRVRINRPPSHSGCRGKRVSASDEAAAAATEAAEAAMAQAKELSMAMGVLAAENQDLKEQVIFERRRAEAAEATLQQQQGTILLRRPGPPRLVFRNIAGGGERLRPLRFERHLEIHRAVGVDE